VWAIFAHGVVCVLFSGNSAETSCVIQISARSGRKFGSGKWSQHLFRLFL